MSTPLPVRTGRSGWAFSFYTPPMPKISYSKSPLSYIEQIDQLKSRGLSIENEEKAIHILTQISYYRLSGYWYPMLEEPKSEHKFKEHSTFENGFMLYCFDRELRKLIQSELEKIEVAIRSKMIYILWHNHDAFWFNKKSFFKSEYAKDRILSKFEDEYKRADEDFISAFREKYEEELPPACMMLEITSFGSLSFIYKNLKSGSRDRKEIAKYFGLDDKTFASWLHSLSYIRNVCAHHSRIWNKLMGISPMIPYNPKNKFISNVSLPNPNEEEDDYINNNRVYFVLAMITYLLNVINPGHSLIEKFHSLLKKYPMIDIKSLGFPENWEKEPLWQKII